MLGGVFRVFGDVHREISRDCLMVGSRKRLNRV